MSEFSYESIVKNIKYPKRIFKGLDDIDLSSFRQYIEGDRIFALGIRLTNTCNYKCIYCGTAEKRGADTEQTLTTDRYLDLIDQAAEIGVSSVIFGANGEPLLTRDIVQILGRVHYHKMTPIIFTNASVFGNDKLCEKCHGISGAELLHQLDEMGVSLIISCETIRKEKYNKIVGVEGYEYFEKAIERIRNSGFVAYQEFLGKPLCRIALSTVIMPVNYEDRYEMMGFAHSLNGLIIMKVPSLHGAAKENIDKMFPIEEANIIKKELEQLSDKQATLQILNLACVSWTLGISISNEGNYMTCMTDEKNPYAEGVTAGTTRLKDLIGRRKELLKLRSTVCPVKDKYYVQT